MSKEWKNGFGIVGIIITAVAVLGGGVYFLFVRMHCEPISSDFVECSSYGGRLIQKFYRQSTQSQTTPLGSAGTPSLNENIKDWKTYRNEKYGFEVRYPTEWRMLSGAVENIPLALWSPERVDARDTIESYVTAPNLFFSVVENTQKLNFLEWFHNAENKGVGFDGKKPERITFNNDSLSAWTVILPGLGDGENTIFVSTPNKNNFIKIVMGKSYINLKGIDRSILSTFKFIK